MTSLLIALGLAGVWLLLCGLVAEFAAKRGHSATLWYLFCLFFTPCWDSSRPACCPRRLTWFPPATCAAPPAME